MGDGVWYVHVFKVEEVQATFRVRVADVLELLVVLTTSPFTMLSLRRRVNRKPDLASIQISIAFK